MFPLIYLTSFLLFLFQTLSICPDNCLQCRTATSCSACSNGYFLVAGTSCSLCPNNCNSCTSENQQFPVCTQCILPAQLMPNGKCLICHPACTTCTNSALSCPNCAEGLVSYNGQCIQSPTCRLPYCAQCRNQSGSAICVRCKYGYFQFLNGCFQCIYPTISCQSPQSFWDQSVNGLLRQRLARALEVNLDNPSLSSLPSYMNNFDFNSMGATLKNGWTLAALVYNFLVRYIGNDDEIQKLKEGVNFYDSISLLSWDEQLSRIVNEINNVYHRGWTVSDLIEMAGTQMALQATIFQCARGYIFLDQRCYKCTNNCLACFPAPDICTECDPGYFLDLATSTCGKCSPECKQCTTNPYSCSIAYLPKTAVGGISVPCDLSCQTCRIPFFTKCTLCHNKFSPQPYSNGTCYQCVQDSCQKCQETNTSICLNCRKGFVLLQGSCYSCPQNCAYCLSNKTSCYTCIEGYTINNQKCQACGFGCILCIEEHPTVCLLCQRGLYLDKNTGSCFKCPQKCLQCGSANICYRFETSIVIFKGVKGSCITGCRNCLDTPTYCTQCKSRFYLNIVNTACQLCPQNCLTCQSQSQCTTCLNNYHLIGTSCVQCLGNCLQCDFSNRTKCLSCKSGYNLQIDQCVQYNCSSGCLQCNQNRVCKKCFLGYGLSSHGNCIKCLSTCNGYCDPFNVLQCLGCADGFELKNKQCVRCPNGCTSCLNGACISCEPAYNLVQLNNGSITCSKKCKFPCFECVEGTCIRCQIGYIKSSQNECILDTFCNPNCPMCPQGSFTDLSIGNGFCVKCIKNGCSICLSGQTCLSCLQGYYYNSSNHECFACSPQCLTCYHSQRCNICAEGYVKQIIAIRDGLIDAVYGEKCLPCLSNCKKCSILPNQCTSCVQNYQLIGFECVGAFLVKFNYTLNQNFYNFTSNYRSQQFIEDIALLVTFQISNIFLQSIKQGSTLVNGYIPTLTEARAHTVSSLLGNSLLPRFNVISSIISIVSSNPGIIQPSNEVEQVPPTQQKKSEVSIVIIAGAGGGGLILVILIIIVICRCRSKRKAVKGHVEQFSLNQASSEVQIGEFVELHRQKGQKRQRGRRNQYV